MNITNEAKGSRLTRNAHIFFSFPYTAGAAANLYAVPLKSHEHHNLCSDTVTYYQEAKTDFLHYMEQS